VKGPKTKGLRPRGLENNDLYPSGQVHHLENRAGKGLRWLRETDVSAQRLTAAHLLAGIRTRSFVQSEYRHVGPSDPHP
jgi:hypothetical protein